ncbi:AI-2E family transporter [Halorubrum ezzemoulense]|uniref:AI-2E family transporter n=1 Tax=Halorubrum ezzemoulense TaxID=337243 RepID=UPI00232E9352|nr:AI-2E family transporter [Halorubrum ezzemoulense]MDB2225969.1 AI-2E family transporter [Halorubrum ezzemoulense]MDB2262156.1 AI-2E family transporter [Halorubrum ezzemoulense]MDB2268880.1 AI-2E family transporter [Halorubrum ezzemoulense]
MEYSSGLRRRIIFGIGGLGLVAAVIFVLIQFQATLIFTIFLYYASRPIYRKLENLSLPSRLQGHRVPYRCQVLAMVTIAIFLLPFLLLLTYTLILVVPEIQRLAGGDGPGAAYISALQSAQGSGLPGPLVGLEIGEILGLSPEEVVAILNDPAVQTWIEQTVATLTGSVGFIANAALHGFILLAGTYYMLTDGSRLGDWFLNNFDESGVVGSYAVAVDDELSSILFGNILNAFVTGIIGILVFSGYNLVAPGAVNVPFAPLVGALTGAGSLIPVVGMKIVYLPVGAILAIAAVTSGQASAFGFVILFLVLAFVVVDTIPDFLIRPYVSGNRTHVGLLMFAYILGPIAFGFYGIFLGPILLVLFAEFFRTIASYVLTGRQPHEQSSLSDY